MVQQEALTLLKQGDPKVICNILNASFRPLGIIVRVTRRADCLHILLESPRKLNRDKAVAFVQKYVAALQVETIATMMIYCRRLGQRSVDWYQQLALIPAVVQPPADHPLASPLAAPSPTESLLENSPASSSSPGSSTVPSSSEVKDSSTDEADTCEIGSDRPENESSALTETDYREPDPWESEASEPAQRDHEMPTLSGQPANLTFTPDRPDAGQPDESDNIISPPDIPDASGPTSAGSIESSQEPVVGSKPVDHTPSNMNDPSTSTTIVPPLDAVSEPTPDPTSQSEPFTELPAIEIPQELEESGSAETAQPDFLQRPEFVVLFIFAIVIALWDVYIDLIDEEEIRPLTGRQLARRLGVNSSTISRRKEREGFPAWAQDLDPDGIGWRYDQGWFVPLEDEAAAAQPES
jgi:hypothetical protein